MNNRTLGKKAVDGSSVVDSPNPLVETSWVEKHLGESHVRILEVDYEPASGYYSGHVPGAEILDWRNDLNDPLRREPASKEKLQRVLSERGVGEGDAVVLYGDYDNWFASYAFWLLDYRGFKGQRLMNGGRKKWLMEGRRIDSMIPASSKSQLELGGPKEHIRAYREQVLGAMGEAEAVIVDNRSPAEFSGELKAPAEYPSERAQRAGHIPGAKNVPVARLLMSDGSFKDKKALVELFRSAGVTPNKDVITYCRIGERSSMTWFVLTQILGFPRVRNYDGSWAEWGNAVGLPVER
jgi:thiosulfate/3-mercaptopyruvate sulfurtransferase